MVLSDEQMGAVRHGSAPSPWRLLDPPAGPQPIPWWAKGLHVDFADGYGNAPRYKVKGATDLRRWDDKVFTFKNGCYLARSGDGRGEAFYHAEPRIASGLKRWRAADGTIRNEPRWLQGGKIEAGEWEEYEGWATPKSEGFGGWAFPIKLDDGRDVILRGPWHGPCPDGFVECSYVDASKPIRPWRGDGPSWLRTTATGGLLVDRDLFVAIFSRFAPHLRLVEIDDDKRKIIQAIKPEWDCPKSVWLKRERERGLLSALAALAAADGPLEPVLDHGSPFPTWAAIGLSHAKLAEPVNETGRDWRNRRYQITDAGRAAVNEATAA